MEFNDNNNNNNNEDYYTILGLSSDANVDEIRQRFITLSRAFHPDKQKKYIQFANHEFSRIDRAYKILTDPSLRVAYDMFGEKGVETIEQNIDKIQVSGPQLRTPDEIRQIIEHILRRENERKLFSSYYSKANVSMEIDARHLLENPIFFIKKLFHIPIFPKIYFKNKKIIIQKKINTYDDNDESIIKLTNKYIKLSTFFDLSKSISGSIGGYMISSLDNSEINNGFIMDLNYIPITNTDPSFHIHSDIGEYIKLNGTIRQYIGKGTTFSFQPSVIFNEYTGIKKTDLRLTINQEISNKVNYTFSWSPISGIMTGIHWIWNKIHFMTNIICHPTENISISSYLSKKLMDKKKTYIKIGAYCGTDLNLSINFLIKKMLSNRSRGKFGIDFSLYGISLKFGFTRGNISFSLPILLCPFTRSNIIHTLCITTLAPILISSTIKQIILPKINEKRKKSIEEKHINKLTELENAWTAANIQQYLMKKIAVQKTQIEKDNNGLVIMVARYGTNPSNSQIHDFKDSIEIDSSFKIEDITCIDVTIPLQFFVKDSHLHLPGMTKKNLLGFFYSHLQNHPELYIRYSYGKNIFEITFKDINEVILPNIHAKYMGKVGNVY